MSSRHHRFLAGGIYVLTSLLLVWASPAHAAEDELELWLNPSLSAGIAPNTSVELETAQRLRGSPADDTYYGRLWLSRRISDAVKVGVAAERRWQGRDEETRLLQQVSVNFAAIALRTRLEQRFVSSDPRIRWALRQRVGTSLPLSSSGEGWSLVANFEAGFTLRSGEPGDQQGLTGLRSFVGVEREIGPVELTLGYLRQQDVEEGAADRVGHAPFIGLGVALP